MRFLLTALCLIAVATLAHADAPDDHSMVVIASKYTNFVAGGNDTYEFSVEFADTGHTESLTLTTYGSAGGTVEVFIVIDDVAMLQHSQLLDGSGEAQINDLAIFVEGTVGFRVVVDANSSGDVFWSMSQPRADADFAESAHRSGRGHCSTGDSQNSLFAILGAMALLGAASIVVTRRRA
jgi:LPXTG-motif cell wall-anchored protein